MKASKALHQWTLLSLVFTVLILTFAKAEGLGLLSPANRTLLAGEPIANDDNPNTNEDTPIVIDVIDNDSDGDNSILPSTLSIVDSTENGTLEINGDFDIEYTPDEDFNGVDVFTYQVEDDQGVLSNIATVTITVNDVNDKPKAVADDTTIFVNTAVQIAILANDSDVDGTLDPSTLQLTVPGHGTALFSVSGIITYTPNTDYYGTDSFTYSVRDDDNSKSNNATVTITIVAPPVALEDDSSTPEDTHLTIDILNNDADIDGIVVQDTIHIVDAPKNGMADTLDAQVVYTPDQDFNGSDSLTYYLTDVDGNTSDTATVSIEVTSVNDAPVANPDVVSTGEDSPIAISVLDNDTDVDGSATIDAGSLTTFSSPSNGDVSIAEGQITYTPDADFSGTDQFIYEVSDDGGLSDTAKVTINVLSLNDAPVANDDAETVDEDFSIVIDLLANDSDSDGTLQPSTVGVTSGPNNGSVDINPTTGAATYTPDLNFNGTDSFTYTVEDDSSEVSNSATVTITVNEVNDPPVTVNDFVITPENTPIVIAVLDNDSDVDGSIDPFTILISPASNGSTTLKSDGTVTYTPNSDFTGTGMFNYAVRDDDGALSNTGTATIDITDVPSVVDENITVDEGDTTEIDVLANDSDSNGLNSGSLKIVDGPDHGTATVDSIGPLQFVITYAAEDDYSGSDFIIYTVEDVLGVVSAPATVNITVTPLNDVPVATDDDATTPDDVPVLIEILANDFDIDGTLDSTSVAIESNPTNGTALYEALTGTVTYTPNADFNGEDTFTYTVQDNEGGTSNPATVTVDVTYENDLPVAAIDNAETDEDTAVVIDVLANDSDPDDSLNPSTVTIDLAPLHGDTDIDGSTGAITYTPDTDFFGDDSLTYSVQDVAGGTSELAKVYILVNSVNDAPVAVEDAATTEEESAVEIDVLANDSDVEDGIDATTVEILVGPKKGTASKNSTTGVITYTPAQDSTGMDSLTYRFRDAEGALSNTAKVTITIENQSDVPIAIDDDATTDEDTPVTIEVTANDTQFDVTLDLNSLQVEDAPLHGTFQTTSAGEIIYTPILNFSGEDTLTYTVANTDGDRSAPAEVRVTVSPVNDRPNVNNDSGFTSEDTPITIAVLLNDTDVDDSIDPTTLTIILQPKNGTAEILTGQIKYTPAENFSEKDTLEYSVKDLAGAESDTASVVITVSPVNDPPVAGDDFATTTTETLVSINILDNDFDIDGTLNTATLTIGLAQNGVTGISPGGVLSYTPNAGFSGKDSLTYSIKDNFGAPSNIAKVRINVGSFPVANNDVLDVAEDVSGIVDILSNDSDPDGDLDSSTVAVFTPPTNGSISVNNINGEATYLPNQDFSGTDSFLYTVEDNDGNVSTPATVTVNVAEINDTPVAVADSAETDEEVAVVLSVLDNDSDVENEINPETVTITSAPKYGTAVAASTGEITYTPELDFFGRDSLYYTVDDDSTATSNEAVAIFIVAPVNDAPVAQPDDFNTNEDTPVVFTVHDNDSDIDGSLDLSTINITIGPENGSTTFNSSTGAITYTPAADYSGPDSLFYTIEDNDGGVSNEVVVRLTIAPVNDAPVAVNDTVSTSKEVSVNIPVTANDFDVDGTINNASLIITQASNGTLTLHSNGSITYAPGSGYTGADTFTYSFKDNNGVSSNTATVSLSVTDAPVALNDTVSTNEGISVEIDVAANDSDGDGSLDLSSVIKESEPGFGTATVNSTTGVITYTPNANVSGQDSFTYTIKDNQGQVSNIATVVINVGAVNDPPVAVDDSAQLNQNASVVINVHDNDTDPDDGIDSTTVSIVSGPDNGIAELNSGLITYTPNTGFFGIDSLRYTIKDFGDSTSNAAKVEITVNEFNVKPVAVNDTVATDEDLAVEIDVAANDNDTDGSLDLDSVEIVTASQNGSTSIENGLVIYTPAADFFGADSFVYAIYDNAADSSHAKVFITVNSVNDAPLAVNDTIDTDEDIPVVIEVTSNDSDVEDGTVDPTSLAVIDTAKHGDTDFDTSLGTITYTPVADFSGEDSLSYAVSDLDGASDTTKVYISVNALNDAPVAVNDTASTTVDLPVTIFILANDIDVDGTINPVTVAILPATKGSASINASGIMTYTPNNGVSGLDSMTYTVKDDAGAVSNSAKVFISVGVLPVAAADFATTPEDTPVAIDVLANDSDADGTVNSASVAIAAFPVSGTVEIDTVSYEIVYTPNPNFFGADTLKYTIKDNEGNLSVPASVIIIIGSVNDAPVAVDDTTNTIEDTPVTFAVVTNDVDLDGSIVPTSVAIVGGAVNGTASVNQTTGEITFSPGANFSGSGSVTYTVKDDSGAVSNQAVLNIGIQAENDAPIALADSGITDEDVPLVVDILANDSDDENQLDIGSVIFVEPFANGEGVLDQNGVLTYTPGLNFSGRDSLTYTISDSGGATSALALVIITVTSINDPPIAVNDTTATPSNTPVTLDVLANDVDVDGTIESNSINVTTQPLNGTLSSFTGGSVTYTPSNSAFTGLDRFIYKVSDNEGAVSASATVLIYVGGQNSPQTLTFQPSHDTQVKLGVNSNYGTKETAKVDEGNFASYFKFVVSGISGPIQSAKLRLRVGSGSSDGGDSGGQVFVVSNNLSGGSETWTETSLNGTNAPSTNGSPLSTIGEVFPDQIVEFTVTSAVTGNGTFSFCVNPASSNRVVYSTKEGISPPQLIVKTGIGSGNSAPVANNDNAATAESTPVAIAVLENDTDSDGTLDTGSLTIVSPSDNGTTAINSPGVITYSPDAGFVGADEFSYSVKDDDGATSNIGLVVVTVSAGGNLSFLPIGDTQVKNGSSSTYGTKSTMKVDNGNFRSYLKFNVSGLSGGVQNAFVRLQVSDGSSDGSDSGGAIYLVSNNESGSSTAWNEQSLTYAKAPTPSSSALSTLGSVSANEVVEFDVTSAVTGNGTYSFAIISESGDQVKYFTKESDSSPELLINNSGGSGGNSAPVAVNDVLSTPLNTSNVINVLSNDSDSDGSLDVTTVTVVSAPAHGSATVNANSGVITYTPDNGYTGADSFTYTVEDDDGAVSNAATVAVTVTSGNVAPVAVNDTVQTFEDTPLSFIDVTLNDTDVDGALNLLSVTITSQPSNGSASVGGSFGLASYTPSSGFFGNDQFSYTVADQDGAVSNEATVFITVLEDTSGGGGSSGEGGTFTFEPSDDGQVKVTAGDNNYGTKSTMKVDNGNFRSYLKFNVTGISGDIQSVTLRLRVSSGSSDGSESAGSAYLVSNNQKNSSSAWTEGNLSYNVAPSLPQSALTSVGAVSPNQTVEFDVTSAVSGNGNVSFAIVSSSGDQVKYYTKEGSTSPELVVVSGNGGGGSSNVAPVANNDATSTNASTQVLISVTSNDSDSDGNLALSTLTVVSGPANGTATVNINNGIITYVPNAAFNGTDTFTYQIEDDDGAASNIATVTITVGSGSSSNQAPVAANDAASTSSSTPVTIPVSNNDSDSDGSLDLNTITVVSFPTSGFVTVNGVGGVVYTPNSGFSGSDQFGYTIKDNLGLASNTATVTVSVSGGTIDSYTFEATDDAYVKPNEPGGNYGDKGTIKVEAGSFIGYLKFNVTGLTGAVQSAKVRLHVAPLPGEGSESGGAIYQTSANYDASVESWRESGLTYSNAPEPTGQALSTAGAAPEDSDVEFDVTSAVTGNGEASFALITQSSDQVKYFSRDGDVTPLLIIQAISTGGGNAAPVAQNDNVVTIAGASVVIDVLGNDSDSDGTIDVNSVSVQTVPANGATTVNSTGSITYTPNNGFSGSDSFTYRVKDEDGAFSNTATVSITVNQASSTATLTFFVTHDAQVKLTEPGSNYGDKGTAKVSADKFESYFKFNVSGLGGPVISAKLQLTVPPEADAGSVDGGSIYLVSNNYSTSNDSWVESQLNGVNAPLISGSPVGSMGFVSSNTVAEATVTTAISGNGVFSFGLRSESTDEAKYFTRDSDFSPKLQVTVALTSSAFNAGTPPVAVEDVVTTEPGTPLQIDVLANDAADVVGIRKNSLQAVTSPANGTLEVNPEEGNFTYTPYQGFQGTDFFNYVIFDNDGLASLPAEVKISVTSKGETELSAKDVQVSAFSGVAVRIPVTETAAEHVAIISPPANGTARLDAKLGLVIYTPDMAFTGADEFSYSLNGADHAPTKVSINVQEIVPQVLAFLPTDDAFVRSSTPTDNFGASYELRATNGNAEFFSFLKFDVMGLTGPVRQATLRLFVFDDSEGGAVYRVSDVYRNSEEPWRESGLVWDNAPLLVGEPFGSFNSNGAGEYVEIDVTNALAGDGIISLGLTSHTADAIKFESREASHPPTLMVETGVLDTAEEGAELASKDELALALPTEVSLSPNYPNPFNAETNIRYALPQDAKVKLVIYNIRGQLVRTLVDEEQTPGLQRVRWYGKDNRGIEVGSGVYFMQLEVGEQKFSRRIILQK